VKPIAEPGSSGIIDFGVGHPSGDLLPVEVLRTAAETFLNAAAPADLNYGKRQGDPGFRETLAGFLSRRHGSPTDAEALFVTAGTSQGLDAVCTQFTHPGDTIFIEEPTYSRVFRIFADHGLQVEGIPVDGDGLDVERLEARLESARPALVYVIPSYHNPGGQTLSAERRRRLVELSRRHGFVIAADEVYQMLAYDEVPPPAMGTMIEAGNVLSLGSFSKILAPGMRLGWIQSSPELIDRMLQNGAVCSGGSLNHFSSMVVQRVIESGDQDAHIERLCDAYRRRVETMDSALREHLSDQATWRRPKGGYFFWLELEEAADTVELRRHSDGFGVGFDPGPNSSHRGGMKNCLRLCFARYDDATIREGIERLARLLAETPDKHQASP